MENNQNKKIKSVYILKKILSHVCEHIKLDLIKYSKNIQNKLDISLEDYKSRVWAYKTGERNGKGKEFDIFTNKIVFEGEYLNGKKSGKGIEYYNNGKIKFEGEYLSGKKIQGKKYDEEGNLILILEKNGKGQEFQFIGEYYNGKRWNGEIIDYLCDKKYKIKHGKGYGKEYYFSGEEKTEGEYFNGEIINGKEYNKKGKIMYEGEFLNGEKNGNGKEYYIDGVIRSQGEYFHGRLKKGKEYNCNGDLLFEGEYSNGKRNGKGKEYYVKERGISLNDSFNELDSFDNLFLDELGLIKENNTSELIFEGEYLNGERWIGKGKEFDKYGNITFEGEYLNGKAIKGKEFDKYGNITFEGE